MATLPATTTTSTMPATSEAHETLRWTVSDLEIVPQPLDDRRYEIIDGELCVTTQPNYEHQRTCASIIIELGVWSGQTGAGEVSVAPGIVFSEHEAVAPDVAWVSRDRVPGVVGRDGKLHAAPDLVVEVLSPGRTNESRDRDKKLRLYSRRGVQEYWIANWQRQTLDVYRRERAELRHVATLLPEDTLVSPLLPGFSCPIARFFATLHRGGQDVSLAGE